MKERKKQRTIERNQERGRGITISQRRRRVVVSEKRKKKEELRTEWENNHIGKKNLKNTFEGIFQES
jgi:hypothetical protein